LFKKYHLIYQKRITTTKNMQQAINRRVTKWKTHQKGNGSK